jgi:hypothetical protein
VKVASADESEIDDKTRIKDINRIFCDIGSLKKVKVNIIPP